MSELNTLTGGRTPDGRREYIVPDLQVVAKSAKYEDGDLAEAPVLGVEILSPGQSITDLFVRADRLVKLGASNVWVIWPEKRRAWQVGADLIDESSSKLTLRLPEGSRPDCLNIDLHEMWAVLEQ
jgi:Uma2 family endonuclease